MLIGLYATLSALVGEARGRLSARLEQTDPEAGFTTLEWAVIGSIAFAMAVAIGAGLTAVANNYLGRIG